MSSKYTEEFQKQIVSLRKQGHSVRELCLRYGLGKNTVTDWVHKFATSKDKKKLKQEDELKQIRKDLKYLRQETEILKKLVLAHTPSGKK